MNKNRTQTSKNNFRTIAFVVVLIVAISMLLLAMLADSAEQKLGASMLALIPAAFVSGMLSFLSPCSLPILPAYFAYAFRSQKTNIAMMTVTFFMGLATTMTLVGASLTAIGSLLVQYIPGLSVVGGGLIVVFGFLSITGNGPAGIQFQESSAKTLSGSFLYGATFAIGWTACIGPILGAILTLLATQGTGILQGAVLSFIYALGLGLPLILMATFFSRLGTGSRFWQFIRGKGFSVELFGRTLELHSTGLISGLLLIGMGILLMTGMLNRITQLGLKSNISAWVVSLDEQVRILFGLR